MGKCGGDIARASVADRVALRRLHEHHLGIVAIGGREERQPLDVVPVEVGEQDRPAERRVAELAREALEPGARVEHERRPIVARRDRDARRVTADARELGAGNRCRPAYAAERHPHRSRLRRAHGFSSRRCPSLSSRRCSVSIWSAPRDGDAHRCDGAQRARAPAALEHRALAEDRAGPELGERFAVDLDRQHAVEQQVQLASRAGPARRARGRP